MAQYQSATMAAIDAILKQIYKDDNYWTAFYQYAPLVGMMPKTTDFRGKNMPLPINWANPQGISHTFSYALANQYSSKFDAFTLTRINQYGLATIDGEALEASDTDAGAFVRTIKTEIDGVMNQVVQAMETEAYRSTTGTLGRISAGSTVSTNVVTLASLSDVANFEVGMTLVASATDGGANRAGQELLAKVNRTTGDLTSTSAAWNTVITALAAGDYLMRQGDLNLALAGLSAWLPVSVTATSFFGVDRTLDSVRLGGNFYDSSTTGESIEEALIEGERRVVFNGFSIDKYILSSVDYAKLTKSTGSRVMYPRSQVKAKDGKGDMGSISFSSLQLQGEKGVIDIVSSFKCPQGTAYGLNMSTWQFASLGPAPKILDHDGLRIERVYNQDAYTVRCGYRGNVGCNLPGSNVRVSLPTT